MTPVLSKPVTLSVGKEEKFDLKGIAYILIVTNSLLAIIAGTLISISLSIEGLL